MNILKEFAHNDKCSYLADKEQTTHYKIINDCSTRHCQELIERGYRRFGRMYFRPICATCEECQSIKIDVANFRFSKSMRRVFNKAKHIQRYLQRPVLSQEHLRLFDKYHRYMHHKKGWEYHPTTAQNYFNSFVDGYNEFGYEVLYFDGEKLIGVDLIDVLEEGVSSIYFYYDPDYEKYSLGRLSLYHQIKFAKQNDKKWIYLGYYVEDCPSLAYKSHYEPYLTLEGRPLESEPYIWN